MIQPSRNWIMLGVSFLLLWSRSSDGNHVILDFILDFTLEMLEVFVVTIVIYPFVHDLLVLATLLSVASEISSISFNNSEVEACSLDS